ncbi:MAG: response regulator transcription factor [Verrucomicrobiota bacterium]
MRTLIIEDHPDLLNNLSQTLREEGYAVDTAMDGEEGLAKALRVDYDAIILDVMLPKLDGWGVLSRLRDSKDTPVLMMTARDAVPDRVRGLNIGADDYLTKPCDLTELLARVRALIRRSVGQARPVIEIRDIVIDIGACTVHKSGREVVLTGREYAMIEYMVLKRGRVVTRSMLYDHLLDEDEDTMSNLIDVHVYNLRKKLGSDFILTRRGLGYIVE